MDAFLKLQKELFTDRIETIKETLKDLKLEIKTSKDLDKKVEFSGIKDEIIEFKNFLEDELIELEESI